MKKYGIGYKGSKSRIAEQILDMLPTGNRFVDLFAGGCAVTHCAMQSGWYDRFLMVDVSDVPQLFLDLITGKVRPDLRRWVSREEFNNLKDTDPFIRVSWSFGNNCETYIYGREIEPYKHACHVAIVDDDWSEFAVLCPEVLDSCKEALAGKTDINERRLAFGPAVVRWMREHGTPEMIAANPLYKSIKTDRYKMHSMDMQSMERQNRINNLKIAVHMGRQERMKDLQTLQSMERQNKLTQFPIQHMMGRLPEEEHVFNIEFLHGSYELYRHEAGDVVYADPPYITASHGSKQYNLTGDCFDKEKFCDWVRTRDYPVFVSEYTMPGDFVEIWSAPLISSYCAQKAIKATERLYLHEKWTPYMPEFKLR